MPTDRERFREICTENINLIKSIKLPEIKTNCKNEAVYIEFRVFPHIEFLIRNMIYKLGNDWSHTIVCGNNNYESILEICKNISPNIIIIKMELGDININTYNNLLLSYQFWEIFTGDKILLYQEDSIIFKNNINDFILYDYIGAPWALTYSANSPTVGNGGFSLRTRKFIIEILKNKTYEHFLVNKYYGHFDKTAEDLYFSLVCLAYNLGNIPHPQIASLFATENVNNSDSLGGHQFWNSDRNWLNRMETLINSYKNIKY